MCGIVSPTPSSTSSSWARGLTRNRRKRSRSRAEPTLYRRANAFRLGKPFHAVTDETGRSGPFQQVEIVVVVADGQNVGHGDTVLARQPCRGLGLRNAGRKDLQPAGGPVQRRRGANHLQSGQ